MEIHITKGHKRNSLKCIRNDGSFIITEIGSKIPYHDLAHYVVEKGFGIKNGFYGNINSGFSFEELSNKEIIQKLDPEVWLSEIMARNLQSLGADVVSCKEYRDLVMWEAQNYSDIKVPKMNLKDIEKLKDEFILLSNNWYGLPENGVIKLLFD
ncbi:hypothetical protein [Flagellimonas marina]|uniref:Uncharacterized protein n=1 Tax=Flagellimonas marina TaxID=1775168 RepID=A0ABV8PNZ9_9FLAO